MDNLNNIARIYVNLKLTDDKYIYIGHIDGLDGDTDHIEELALATLRYWWQNSLEAYYEAENLDGETIYVPGPVAKAWVMRFCDRLWLIDWCDAHDRDCIHRTCSTCSAAPSAIEKVEDPQWWWNRAMKGEDVTPFD